MKREAERLQLAKSGYADSQLADPEVPQEPDIEALCAKAARTYDLTRREEDVLRLLVEGRTAPQIAEELVVSPNTVKTHVRNLYRKLGINRRADLACRLEIARADIIQALTLRETARRCPSFRLRRQDCR